MPSTPDALFDRTVSGGTPPQQTILVVDDTPANIDVLMATLRPQYRVQVASDGMSAVRIVESDDPPDLILLDVMMPGISGFDVCRMLKANPERSNIPVIFVTSLREANEECHGLDVGAVDYITKPFNPTTVRARVRKQLEIKLSRDAITKELFVLSEVVRAREPRPDVEEHLPVDLTVGMVVARTIRTDSGAVLLSAGTALRQEHIRDLTRCGVHGGIELPVHVFRARDF
jgi:DNA-binding response OmpR family regulator